MANKMAKDFISNGGEIKLTSEITNLKEENDHVEIQVRNENKIEAEFLISCAGLQSDRLAKLMGLKIDFQILTLQYLNQ